MNELINITVNDNHEPVVSGRDLHKVLEIKTQYTKWLERMSEYGFVENEDFMAKSMQLGLFELKKTAINHSDGHTTTNVTPKVTGKGQQYFINKFLNQEYLPV